MIKSKSDEEETITTVHYNSKNPIAYSPDVVGKKGGISDVSICAGDDRKIFIKFPWGENLSNIILGKE